MPKWKDSDNAQDQYDIAKGALEVASMALLRLKNKFGVIPDDIYYAEFDTPIVLMENKLKELMGEEDEL
tara:strand:- start:326 stop:532 length:207 start_codon:yes stop_codon:yes gene_type:complete